MLMAQAALAGQSGDFTYEVVDMGGGTNAIRITKYTGTASDVTVPDTLEGQPVTILGKAAFSKLASLTNVNFPAGLEVVEEAAFGGCVNLACAQLPAHVQKLGMSAFSGCYRLGTVTLPDTLARIDNEAFYSSGLTNIHLPSALTNVSYSLFAFCSNLTQVTLPANLTHIGSSAFMRCPALQQIDLPPNLAAVGDYAFYGCGSLTSLRLPARLAVIGVDALQGCNAITNIAVDAGNPSYSSANGVLFNAKKTALYFYPKPRADSYVIPASVTTIESRAFQAATGLVNVTFPPRLYRIGYEAFSFCSQLQNFTLPDSLVKLDTSAFAQCPQLTEVVVPDNVTDIGYAAFFYCVGLERVILGRYVRTVGDYAFYECRALKDVYFTGDAPEFMRRPYFSAFTYAQNLYYVPSTSGWLIAAKYYPVKPWWPSYALWMKYYKLDSLYPKACAETDDADGDGQSNFAEMRTGTDPANRASALRFENTARPTDWSLADQVSVDPLKYANFYFNTVPGKRYEVQACADLSETWKTLKTISATTTQARVVAPQTPGCQFFRVKLVE